jgi:hypothetical protein
MRLLLKALIVLVMFLSISCAKTKHEVEARKGPPLEYYNVVWQTPSRDSSGSMPLGNGDIGLNVWAEADGDLLFYIGKTDAWSENVRLLKLGRVRVKLEPNPFLSGLPFEQTLRLGKGEIEIRAGKPELAINLKLWVDADRPVIHIEGTGKEPFQVQLSLEVWRNEKRLLRGQEIDSAYGLHRNLPGGGTGSGPIPVIVYPDTILPAKGNRIVWFHRNQTSIWPATMKLQELQGFMQHSSDPLLNRTFGGVIEGEGLVSRNATTLVSVQPREQFSAAIYVLTEQTPAVQDWVRSIGREIDQVKAEGVQQAWQAHQKWWENFWNRSWIRVSGSKEAEKVTEGYILQRFINACGGRGAYPIKFNGSIFTVEAREPGAMYDADYRKWGGPYWFQNTRLIYWPMLTAGDFDLMQPFFEMYRHDLPLAQFRTRLYFGHGGAFFPETMYFWGAYPSANYGWDRKGKPISYVENTYIRYYWQGGLELTAMMLDYYAYTQDKAFAKDTLLPLAEATTEFYTKHYPRDAKGKILLKPAQALETWQDVVNPMPEIAGLQYDLPQLLDLPSDLVTDQQRAAWKDLLGELPLLPTHEKNGHKMLAAAQESQEGPARNVENPELYAIFPYRLYAVDKPNLDMARLTFDHRQTRQTGCWCQDAIQAAFLGLTRLAHSDVVENFSTHDPGSRFPAFWFGIPQENWTPDWKPDQDHGGVSMMALESMLMQTEGKKLLLFPAWPKEWDVEFKLRAPLNTIVEGVYRAGKVEQVRVTPSDRTRNVVELKPN